MQSDSRQTAQDATAGLDLFPISVVAFGSPAGSGPRLMAVQSAVAKCVAMLAAFRLSSLRIPHPSWLRPRAQ
jgi:hypothetical protein